MSDPFEAQGKLKVRPPSCRTDSEVLRLKPLNVGACLRQAGQRYKSQEPTLTKRVWDTGKEEESWGVSS
jgi:hypothetical protein